MSVEDSIKQRILADLGAYHDVKVELKTGVRLHQYYSVTIDHLRGAIDPQELKPENGGITKAVKRIIKLYKGCTKGGEI